MVFGNKTWCFLHIITAFLIALFITQFIVAFHEQRTEIERLREDLNALAQRQTQRIGKCSGRQANIGDIKYKDGTYDGKCSDQLTKENYKSLLDSFDNNNKKKFAHVWDYLRKLRKEVQTIECTKSTLSQSYPLNCQNDIDKPTSAIQVRVNYATEDLGAKIVDVFAEPIGGSNFLRAFLNLDYITNPPINMLRSSMEPGNCFGFQSSIAVISIQLAKEVYVDSFELEHISSKLSPTGETQSAPKDFEVFVINKLNDGRPISIGFFTYDNNPQNLIQLFTLKTIIKVGTLKFSFKSNHGNPNFTCIYRLAVYGSLSI